MTDSSGPAVPSADASEGAVAPDDAAGASEGSAAPPRPGVFSLEGRATPGLYLVGWIATVMGLAVLVVSFLSAGSAAAPWLFLAALLVLAVGVVATAGSQAVERSRRMDLAYRGPSPVLVFLVVILLTLIGVLIVLAPLSALGLDARSPIATTLSLLLTTLVYVGVVRLLVVGPGALSWRDMGLARPAAVAVRDFLLGAAFAVPVLAMTLLLGGVLSRFLPPSPSPLPAIDDGFGLLANLLSAAVLAPIGEELFFRGFATTAWAKAVGVGPAVVRGAVFFSIAHVLTLFDASFAEGAQRALFSFVGLLPVGLVLGWLFLRRGSLYAAIGLHAAYNAMQVLLLFMATRAA